MKREGQAGGFKEFDQEEIAEARRRRKALEEADDGELYVFTFLIFPLTFWLVMMTMDALRRNIGVLLIEQLERKQH